MKSNITTTKMCAEAVKALIAQQYTQLAGAVVDPAEQHLVIMRKSKSFWAVDKKYLRDAKDLAIAVFSKKIKRVTLKDIEQWEN